MKRRSKTLLQITLITAIAVGTYCALRTLPDSDCGFLHYEVLDVDSDGIEFCKADSSAFLELSKLNFPLKLDLIAEDPPRQGTSSEFTLTLLTPGNKQLLPHQIAKTHTKKVHLLLIDTSLEDYHHIHPEPVGASGQWTFHFTPKKTGTYYAFAQLVPARTKKHIVASNTIEVPGTSAQPTPQTVQTTHVAGYTFHLELSPKRPTTRQMHDVHLTITGDKGEPVHLEPLMGAYAHMIAFDESLSGIAHLHPIPNGRETEDTPQVDFVLNTAKPGYYRVWAQVKIQGTELFAPFDLIFEAS